MLLCIVNFLKEETILNISQTYLRINFLKEKSNNLLNFCSIENSLSFVSLQLENALEIIDFNFYMLQMNKMKPREVKLLAQSHTVSETAHD